jgi:hypothetical protein
MPGDPLDPPPPGGDDPLDVGGTGAAIVASWTSSCVVKKDTKASDGAGGYTTAAATLGTYACNLSKATRFAFSESQGMVVGSTFWECQLPLEAASHARPGAYLTIDEGSDWEILETDEGLSGALVLKASLSRRGR